MREETAGRIKLATVAGHELLTPVLGGDFEGFINGVVHDNVIHQMPIGEPIVSPLNSLIEVVVKLESSILDRPG